MPRIIYLNQLGSGCFALEADNGEIWPYIFLSEDQVREFLGLDESDQTPVDTFDWIPISGGPSGYRLFALQHASGHMSVVVIGPFGLLPGTYPNLAAAIGAADQDYMTNTDVRPVDQNRSPNALI